MSEIRSLWALIGEPRHHHHGAATMRRSRTETSEGGAESSHDKQLARERRGRLNRDMGPLQSMRQRRQGPKKLPKALPSGVDQRGEVPLYRHQGRMVSILPTDEAVDRNDHVIGQMTVPLANPGQ